MAAHQEGGVMTALTWLVGGVAYVAWVMVVGQCMDWHPPTPGRE